MGMNPCIKNKKGGRIMAINECGEIVREKMEQEALETKNCNIRQMSRMERFEYLHEQVSKLKQELREANTEKSVNMALDKMADLMDGLSKDNQVSDIKGYIADIIGTIQAVKMHDVTRSSLDDLIQKLLERVKEIIAEERKKESALRLKTLFLELAEHSYEIAQVIDINKIFS